MGRRRQQQQLGGGGRGNSNSNLLKIINSSSDALHLCVLKSAALEARGACLVLLSCVLLKGS